MFILERADQLGELLRCWAWRYKRRCLSQVPFPKTPELFDLLPSLLRYSGVPIQEVWAAFPCGDQLVLWLDEAGTTDSVAPLILPGHKAPGCIGLPGFWDWTASPAVQAPTSGLAHDRDSAGLWKYGTARLPRFEAARTLLITSDHPARCILVRKLLVRLFDPGQILLVDMAESPLSMIAGDGPETAATGPEDPGLAEEKIRFLGNRLREIAEKRFIVLLSDTLPGAFEAALIQQLLDQLPGTQALFICLEPTEHLRFTWTLRGDIREISRVSLPPTEKGHEAMPLLSQISRLLEVIPDRLSLTQIRRWFEREGQQVDTCLRSGYLTERSGQIMIRDLLSPPAAAPVEVDEESLLGQAWTLFSSPLSRLKLDLLQGNTSSLAATLKKPDRLVHLHHQPRQLVRLLIDTDNRDLPTPEIALALAELTSFMFLLPQSEFWLGKAARTGLSPNRVAQLSTQLSQILTFCPGGLFRSALGDAAAGVSNPADLLQKKGFLSLAVIAEAEGTPNGDSRENPGRLTELLFRSRCLDNPDLLVWISLIKAQDFLLTGSPADAAAILGECLQQNQSARLPIQPSLNLCKTLLGHWGGVEDPWPEFLPGGYHPPQKACWHYLHLLLQHRFADAEIRYRDTIRHRAVSEGEAFRTSAGLSPAMLVRFHDHLVGKHTPSHQAAPLPPWLDFVLSALRPFLPSPDKSPPKVVNLPAPVGRERTYPFYEHHYLRFHQGPVDPPASGEERDIFLDTCAFFTRRGRPLSAALESLRSRLAAAALAENRASDAILIRSAQSARTIQDLLNTALGILQSRFSPRVCILRLLDGESILAAVSAPRDGELWAKRLFSQPLLRGETQLSPDLIQQILSEAAETLPWNLGAIRLFGLPLERGSQTLQVLLGYELDPQPSAPMQEALQRCLAPLLQILAQNHDLTQPSPLDDMIGESPVIQALKKQIRQVSRVDFTVTIQGESGTGKELIARAIHRLSPRRDKPFIAFNCASLPETLLEAELMGVAKGAFTDARENRAGLIEGAEGGTLFLDEIGEMPLLLQAKLLRFLSDHTIRRLGENQVRTVDCRVLCATHRDLGDMVAAKTFREDLFYRIQELTVLSPPLRHRQEDLPLLLDHFLKKYGFTGLGQTERHWLALKWMPLTWPGNIRELESRIKELITYHPHHPDLEGAASLQPLAEGPLHHSRSQFERLCVLSTLEKNGWSRNRSAAALGISRIGLFKLMRKHRITDPDTGPPF